VHVAGHEVDAPLHTVFEAHVGDPGVPAPIGLQVPNAPAMLHAPQFELLPLSHAVLQQKPSTQ
jgi:hypothetical protein